MKAKIIFIAVAFTLVFALAVAVVPQANALDEPCAYKGLAFVDNSAVPAGTLVRVMQGGQMLGQTLTAPATAMPVNFYYIDNVVVDPGTMVTFEIYWDCGDGSGLMWQPATESATQVPYGSVYTDLHIWCALTPTPTPNPIPTPTPTLTPYTIQIDANPFLFVYGMIGDPPEVIWTPDCGLPEALTNIGPNGLDVVITVWGTEGGNWVSFDTAHGAGSLRELVHGKPYIMTLTEGAVGNLWEMPE